jgi:hydrogenase-4 component F
MTLLALLAAPLLGGGALALLRQGPGADRLHVGTSALTALLAAAVVAASARGEVLALEPLSLRADPLSTFMVALVGGVALLAGLALPAWLRVEIAAGRVAAGRGAVCRALFHLFVFSMLLAVTTDSVGLMWVAVEGTTLASVFLITLERRRGSVEAAYKYLLICSVGIAVAFMGTVLVYLADLPSLGAGDRALSWSALVAVAPDLPPRVLRLAFAFLLIGYGTKAGLVPLHTWLPDAHSEAPAPVSALMSGVLLGVGLYALFRFKVVVDLAVGPGFTGGLLAGFGILSMAVAAVFLWSPRSYKRMLAYSSVEHVGLVCVGVGLGGSLGAAGGLLHLAGHALAKSSLFLLAGQILQRFGSAEVSRVRGLRQVMPWTSRAFLLGILGLLGLPPSGLFVSEVLIVRAGLASGAPWVVGVALLLLVAAFGGMLRTVHRMVHGEAPAHVTAGEAPGSLAPVWVSLALLGVLGLALPAAWWTALGRVAAVLAPAG